LREAYEFTVPERNAARFLAPDQGTRVWQVRKLVVQAGDLGWHAVREAEARMQAEGRSFFTSWQVRRRYTDAELARAAFLVVRPRRELEPAGEECGTLYDDARACPEVLAPARTWTLAGREATIPASTCGVGARQLGPLYLPLRGLPRAVDFARTIAGELLVSRAVVRLFEEHGLAGARFEPVRSRAPGSDVGPESFQLTLPPGSVELDARTRAGSDPFDEGAFGRCPRGHLAGLNLLSEVTVIAASLSSEDVQSTRQHFGTRRGLLRPAPCLLLSARAWGAIHAAGLRGLVVEVARTR